MTDAEIMAAEGRLRESFFYRAITVMHEDGAGLDAAMVKMRQIAKRNIDRSLDGEPADSELSVTTRRFFWADFEHCEQWFRAKVAQARELVDLADRRAD